MTAKDIVKGGLRNYIGTYAEMDDVDTSADDLSAGSTYTATDREATYVWNGSAWRHIPTVTVDHDTQKTHEGHHYKAGYQDTSMATTDTINVLFITPDTTRWAHWTMTMQATGAVVVEIFEGTTVSANGTEITPKNRNRNSSNLATTKVYHTPTVSNDGTKMVEKWIGTEGFKEEIGGSFKGSNEWILKQNTKYLVRLTAVSNSIKGAVGADWYEHIFE